MKDQYSLARYLSEIRESKKLSINELYSLSGVSPGAIQKIENGSTKTPGFHIIIALAKSLNIPIAKFVLAYEGKDPESYQNADQAEVNAILETAVQNALQKLGHPR